MQRLDIHVRSPTGTAWILALVPFIFGGELLWEALKPEIATFFRIPFSDLEVYAAAAVCGAVSALGFAWVASLYVSPGRLLIDPDLGVMRRERRLAWRQEVVEAPLKEWQVRIQFYSERYRAEGAYRRLELKGPGLHEVLLLSDVPDGKVLCDSLEAAQGGLGSFEIELKQRPG